MDANRELIEALNQIEKEKDISKDILLEALENSLVAACKNNYGRADNIKVNIDRNTGEVNVYAMKEVVNYLYNLGHNKIGYISYTYDNQTTVRKRFEGYCEGLKENKLDYNPDMVVISETLRLNELQGSREAVRKIIKCKSIPSVIMTASDFIAVGVIEALKDLKIKIPEEISVIGFDNILMSQYTDPLLTTIKQPKRRMGITAINLLLDIIEGKKIKDRNIVLPTKLIVRRSVAKPVNLN